MFNEPGMNFFEGVIGLALCFVILVIGVWLFNKLLETRLGEAIYPIRRQFEKLPYTARKVVGWASILVYTVAVVTFLIWLEY